MLLTIATTHKPATDLGYLLHKHPNNVQSFPQPYGLARVFYPEATEERCAIALLMEVDPIALVRGRKNKSDDSFGLRQYVNDRPYVASSFLSVTLAKVFRSALSGKCTDKPELVATKLPLETTVSVLPCRGGEALLYRLFEPLGYQVLANRYPLDPEFSDWGESPYYTVKLKQDLTLKELLTHLYVLIPVLDDEKHYWVGDDEVEKLLAKGVGWLEDHPEKDLIALRYLKHRRGLARNALERLMDEDLDEIEAREDSRETEESRLEEKISLNERRLQTVGDILKEEAVTRVVDLGCGEGKLIKKLLADRQFEKILGMDVSYRTLERASQRLHLDRLPPPDANRIELIRGSLMYRDKRLSGYQAATVIEVIEHLDPSRLAAFERVLFEFAKPDIAVISTPNREYNVLFENLPADKFRHRDHRFEWTRQEFREWAKAIETRFGYKAEFRTVGPENKRLGSPTQLGIFRL